MVYINNLLKQRLDSIKKIQKKNWDCVILIDGKERSGKSTLGLTIGAYLQKSFSIGNVASDTADAKKKAATLRKGSVLLIDEGSLVFNSKDSMAKEQRQLLKIMDVIGQKNMVFIIILPAIFDLNKTIAVRRSRFLLHVYTDKRLNRGRFCYFGENKKAYLYEYGKKNVGSYAKPESNFQGRFVDYNPLGPEYLELKKQSLIAALDDGEKKVDIVQFKKQLMMKIVETLQFRQPDATLRDKAAMIGIPESSYRRYVRDLALQIPSPMPSLP